MTRAMLITSMFLIIFLVVLPLHEEVTVIHEVALVGMIVSCFMFQLRCVYSALFSEVHVRTHITMDEILERHPEYRYPRNSHRI